MVEAASSRTGNMCDLAVHHLAALFVGVEILVNEVPQKASALRNSYGIHAFHRRSGLGIIFQIGKKIPNRRQSYAHHCRILGRVDQLIYLAGNETAVEMNVMRISLKFA